MRTNSRLSARAIDSPIDVFPVPGGPISVRIAPERLSSAMPRSWRSLRTARYSTIRSFTSSSPAWSASRISRASFGSRRWSEFALGRLTYLLGHVGCFDLRALLVDDRGLVHSELLADRVHLLAQEVLALL